MSLRGRFSDNSELSPPPVNRWSASSQPQPEIDRCDAAACFLRRQGRGAIPGLPVRGRSGSLRSGSVSALGQPVALPCGRAVWQGRGRREIEGLVTGRRSVVRLSEWAQIGRERVCKVTVHQRASLEGRCLAIRGHRGCHYHLPLSV